MLMYLQISKSPEKFDSSEEIEDELIKGKPEIDKLTTSKYKADETPKQKHKDKLYNQNVEVILRHLFILIAYIISKVKLLTYINKLYTKSIHNDIFCIYIT